MSTPLSRSGCCALRDATPGDHGVLNPFDVKDRGFALSCAKVVTGVGNVLAPGSRIFPNVLPAKGARRRHARGLRKRNATPLRFLCNVALPNTAHPSRQQNFHRRMRGRRTVLDHELRKHAFEMFRDGTDFGGEDNRDLGITFSLAQPKKDLRFTIS
jgi:hypothetical protein